MSYGCHHLIIKSPEIKLSALLCSKNVHNLHIYLEYSCEHLLFIEMIGGVADSNSLLTQVPGRVVKIFALPPDTCTPATQTDAQQLLEQPLVIVQEDSIAVCNVSVDPVTRCCTLLSEHILIVVFSETHFAARVQAASCIITMSSARRLGTVQSLKQSSWDHIGTASLYHRSACFSIDYSTHS